jgi:hypothetical protein
MSDPQAPRLAQLMAELPLVYAWRRGMKDTKEQWSRPYR